MTAVLLELDTRPPVVAVRAATRVEPPDNVEIIVVADEPFCWMSVEFHDSLGGVSVLGVEAVSETMGRAVLGGDGLPTGTGTIVATVADLACNETTAVAALHVARPRAFDTVLVMSPGMGGVGEMGHPYNIAAVVEPAFAAEPALVGAYPVEATLEPAFHTYLEVTNGD